MPIHLTIFFKLFAPGTGVLQLWVLIHTLCVKSTVLSSDLVLSLAIPDSSFPIGTHSSVQDLFSEV